MPPVPLLWLVVFELFVRISLLKFVLVRWCLDAVSMSCVLGILGVDVISFGAWHASFGMLVASTLALGDHRAIHGNFGAQEGRPWGPGVDFC